MLIFTLIMSIFSILEYYLLEVPITRKHIKIQEKVDVNKQI